MGGKRDKKQSLSLVPAPAPEADTRTPQAVVTSLLRMHRTIESRLDVLLQPETTLPPATLQTVIRSCVGDYQHILRIESRQVFPDLQSHALQVASGGGRLSQRMQMAALSRRLIGLFGDMFDNEAALARSNLMLARGILKKALLIRHRYFYQPLLATSSAIASANPRANSSKQQ